MTVNAAEQAVTVQMASKLGAIVHLFKQCNADLRADLHPWADDPHTRNLVDPDSIDIGFHLPGWSRRWQARSLLLQIRLYCDPDSPQRRAIGLDIVGFSYMSEQWRFSSIGAGVFSGNNLPSEDLQQQLRSISQKILAVLNT
ncbi:hypothetical protein RHJ63_03240 [Thermosynechococcus sp. JY1334]|nr:MULTISPECIES: hypothetical protein [unclassified Thermosynechococcus]WKT81160.1 hypothetical protein QYC27_12880 [Thermosynechococcus sp. PP45]WKT83633.1 hypothetical protein QYC28_12600 [Thermosynechococcus sp. HY596]WKT86953.1 hypothetical protein QYC30_03205 [Thermosynechococcus sp. JY1339]WNC22218.1 hypothetical protein RHG98_12640 [Thermosynechococcus sp. PP22]WNC24771.1 hypothetical protein RHH26_12875 [Thermosynechococcus sp. PP551]WNC27348.1 hypothetical protein RHH27_12870 [Thermo